MIKRIFIVIVIIFLLAFIVIWILGGGYQNIKAAVNHYRNPFQYSSIIDYFFQIGSTTGETFKLPGTPSTIPNITISAPSTAEPDTSSTNGQVGISEPKGY